MNETKEDIRKQLESTLQELKTTGNDIRKRLGTAAEGAKTQAKQTWQKLEPQLQRAEQQLRDATDDAVEHLEGLFGELKGSLRSLREKL